MSRQATGSDLQAAGPPPEPRQPSQNERPEAQQTLPALFTPGDQSVFLRCWIIMYVSKVFSESWNHRY